MVLAVLAVAMLVQLLPLVTGIVGDRSDSLFGDELGYWELAGGKLWSFLRPPGYPLVVRALRTVTGGTPLALFWVQSLVTAMAPAFVLLLAWEAGVRSRTALLVAGVGSALSLTAISISKRVLADSLLASILLLAVLWLVRSRRKGTGERLLRSGLLAGAALLLKPIAQLWLVLAPVALLAGSWRGLRLLRGILLACLPMVGLLGVGALVNLSRYGVASFSGIGALAVVRYWAPATEGLRETGGHWDTGYFQRLRDEKWTPHDVFSDATELHEFKLFQERALTLLRSEPFWATRALMGAAWRNLPRPYFAQECFFWRGAPPWRVLGGKILTYLLWLTAAVGAIRGLRAEPSRPVATVSLACAVAFGIATAISWSEGARLMFPVEWTLFVFLAIALDRAKGSAAAT